MPYRYDLYDRLEVAQPFEDLNRGFLAEVYDPVWFLGRQWQLGEHQGEDASSPVAVSYVPVHQPIRTPEDNPLQDPTLIPPEAIVESEPDDWWTPGRRIRIGVEAAAAAGLPPVATASSALLLADLPTPYDRLNGLGYDGFLLYQNRAELGLAEHGVFAAVPADPADLWNPAELVYEAQFTCSDRTLSLPRHAGGHVDWYSVDADAPLPPPDPRPDPVEVIPSRMRYPGAPHPRWWQIEDSRVDIGGFPPDRSHFATMLLVDLVVSHSDDWFLFPVDVPAGHAVTLLEVCVRDAFGDEWIVTPPQDGWSLFKVTGLDDTSILVWATVTTPLTGPVLEDVVLGIDEDANMLWAVEQRVSGRDLPTPARPEAQLPNEGGQPVVRGERKQYVYLPSTPMFPYWHPYPIAGVNGKRRFVQGRLADLSQVPAVMMPEPRARVLYDRMAPKGGPAHQIEPATVPSLGLRLERRYVLARGTDGLPVLWCQRRRLPLLAPPAPHLRFDLMEEEIPVA